MFIDSHAHLEGEQFAQDRAQVIARAQQEGLTNVLAIGNGDGPNSLDCAVRLAEQYEFLYATTGVHPHEAALASDEAFGAMEELARHPKVLAWGEIGLDYYYEHSPREVQKNVFVRQMELARAAKLPIIIHCRPSDQSDDAWQDCLRLLDQHWRASGLGGILHCFTGTQEHAQQVLDWGFLISFAGNITFPKAQFIRDVARWVPLDRMLIETDSPFLAPVPHRGKRNEPAFVKQVARQVAELRGLTTEEVGAQTSTNFRRFFSLHEKPASI
ncbi:MAG: TatD family hydrolase [Acidobacteriales bacterium]|nr:TatD family hydrolase [Terriglobales bacterium]